MTNEVLVDRYFDALARRDLTTVRALVHDDLVFKGPLATLDKADDYLLGLEHITAGVERLERRGVFSDGDRVVQIYDVTFVEPAVIVPVAESLRIADGKIAAIEMIMDPRPLVAHAAN